MPRRILKKDLDKYDKWGEWSEEDQVHIGKCPDLITGIHGDEPFAVYGELASSWKKS